MCPRPLAGEGRPAFQQKEWVRAWAGPLALTQSCKLRSTAAAAPLPQAGEGTTTAAALPKDRLPHRANKITISPICSSAPSRRAGLPADLPHAQPPHQRNDHRQQYCRRDSTTNPSPANNTTNPITAAATAPAGPGRPPDSPSRARRTQQKHQQRHRRAAGGVRRDQRRGDRARRGERRHRARAQEQRRSTSAQTP